MQVIATITDHATDEVVAERFFDTDDHPDNGLTMRELRAHAMGWVIGWADAQGCDVRGDGFLEGAGDLRWVVRIPD